MEVYRVDIQVLKNTMMDRAYGLIEYVETDLRKIEQLAMVLEENPISNNGWYDFRWLKAEPISDSTYSLIASQVLTFRQFVRKVGLTFNFNVGKTLLRWKTSR